MFCGVIFLSKNAIFLENIDSNLLPNMEMFSHSWVKKIYPHTKRPLRVGNACKKFRRGKANPSKLI